MTLIISLILLVLDILAIMSIVRSAMTGGTKVLWVLGVVLFPAAGVLVYYLTHRRRLA